jgi:hypothetical protein
MPKNLIISIAFENEWLKSGTIKFHISSPALHLNHIDVLYTQKFISRGENSRNI